MPKLSDDNEQNLNFDIEGENDEVESSDAKPKKPREQAPHIFATEALNAALARKTRALLKCNNGIYILHLPDETWAKHFHRPVRNLGSMLTLRVVTELEKRNGILDRAGTDGLEIVQKGFSTVFVTQDPTNLLDEAVLAAADATITVAPMSEALLRKVIRRVTQQTARGVTAQMTELDIDIILTVIRSSLTAKQCVDNLQRAVDRQATPTAKTVPLLSELPLTSSVRGWTDQMLSDLEEVKSQILPPEALVFAALEGPPGTGKSLIAESLAATSSWNFVSTSVGAWFATSDGALGGVAKKLRAFVDDILAKEPAIGFLDELDALPNRDTLNERGRDWWTPIVTLFLTEIDRLRKSGKRVLLLGASNYYDRLDPALIRPGRLAQRVSVLPPSTDAETLDLLRHFFAQDLSEAEIEKLVRFSVGATPATVEGWSKSAKARARSFSRELSIDDVLTQAAPHDGRSEADILATARHEIGHALVAHNLGHKVESVSILRDGASGGRTISVPPTNIMTRGMIDDLVTIALAGRAADLVLGDGPNAGANGDLAMAADLLTKAQDEYGLGSDLVHTSAARMRPGFGRETLGQELDRLLHRAKSIVLDDIDAAERLVEQLVAEKMLTGLDIAAHLGVPATLGEVTMTSTQLPAKADHRDSSDKKPYTAMDFTSGA
ncbi:MAG: AAA family ATPase [Devosia sp.]